jgi:dipeptidase D
MSDVSSGLEPALLWKRFFELMQIARPSKEESAAREHVLAWASARGLGGRVDAAGNVVVAVPATPGREQAAAVALQSHLDMVCERDPSSPHDPREGRIGVVVDGDWVGADGTTLGADDGIGVAAALAIVDEGVEHGPLELLFTVSEEQGLEGARALDPSLVESRLLVNLDGTSDDAITVGCAGSDHTFLRLALAPEALSPEEVALRVELSGARGGHSGSDIGKGRANAIKALGGALGSTFERKPFRLVSFAGGVSRNAIPREAHAVVAVPAAQVDGFRSAIADALGGLQYAAGLSLVGADELGVALTKMNIKAADASAGNADYPLQINLRTTSIYSSARLFPAVKNQLVAATGKLHQCPRD